MVLKSREGTKRLDPGPSELESRELSRTTSLVGEGKDTLRDRHILRLDHVSGINIGTRG